MFKLNANFNMTGHAIESVRSMFSFSLSVAHSLMNDHGSARNKIWNGLKPILDELPAFLVL